MNVEIGTEAVRFVFLEHINGIRVVHGFPILFGGLEEEPLIRSMREIESWFHDVDKKRLHSLPDTSAHLVTDWLTCNKDKKTAS
jgi:hypothetical protein